MQKCSPQVREDSLCGTRFGVRCGLGTQVYSGREGGRLTVLVLAQVTGFFADTVDPAGHRKSV